MPPTTKISSAVSHEKSHQEAAEWHKSFCNRVLSNTMALARYKFMHDMETLIASHDFNSQNDNENIIDNENNDMTMMADDDQLALVMKSTEVNERNISRLNRLEELWKENLRKLLPERELEDLSSSQRKSERNISSSSSSSSSMTLSLLASQPHQLSKDDSSFIQVVPSPLGFVQAAAKDSILRKVLEEIQSKIPAGMKKIDIPVMMQTVENENKSNNNNNTEIQNQNQNYATRSSSSATKHTDNNKKSNKMKTSVIEDLETALYSGSKDAIKLNVDDCDDNDKNENDIVDSLFWSTTKTKTANAFEGNNIDDFLKENHSSSSSNPKILHFHALAPKLKSHVLSKYLNRVFYGVNNNINDSENSENSVFDNNNDDEDDDIDNDRSLFDFDEVSDDDDDDEENVPFATLLHQQKGVTKNDKKNNNNKKQQKKKPKNKRFLPIKIAHNATSILTLNPLDNNNNNNSSARPEICTTLTFSVPPKE